MTSQSKKTLGKGEVHSSILCGSTINQALPAASTRTEAQHNARTRTPNGEISVESVRGSSARSDTPAAISRRLKAWIENRKSAGTLTRELELAATGAYMALDQIDRDRKQKRRPHHVTVDQLKNCAAELEALTERTGGYEQ